MSDAWLPQAWFARVTDTYNMLWKMVIRPPRDLYLQEELGPAKFRLGRHVFERKDLVLQGPRGSLQCSHFVPAKNPQALRPCVVYLHGNCSSRLEAFDALPVLLPRDLTVFCLDLSGSGRSDGEYISLGYHEERDLRVALQYLRSLPHVGSIGLWGRSMGACTSVLRASEDANVSACVLDSGFQGLRLVAEELVNRGRFPVPKFVLDWALDMIREEVQSRAGFDALQLEPIQFAPRASCPAFFGVAWDDTFVLPHHTQDLHDAWAGERFLRVFDGGHNGVRPSWFSEEAADFLAERLGSAAARKAQHSCAAPAVGLQDPATSTGEGSVKQAELRPAAAAGDRGQLDADVAAGPIGSARLEEEVPRRKHEMALELTKMGFGPDAVVAATRECSTVEEATQWLLKQSQGTFCHVDNNHPKGQRDLGMPDLVPVAEDSDSPLRERTEVTVAAKAESRAKEQQAEMRPASTPQPRRSPPPGSLQERLSNLGFQEQECEDASRRCLSMEAAMDFFQARQVSVRL